MWRDLLGYTPGPPNAEGSGALTSRTAKRKALVQDILAECISALDGVSIVHSDTDSVWWQDIEIKQGNLPPPAVAREILWEIAEISFRLEFAGLDRAARVDNTLSDVRDEMLGKCFCDGYTSVAGENCLVPSYGRGSCFPLKVFFWST